MEPTIYELLGGEAAFRRLAEAFYARVPSDPALLAVYRPSAKFGQPVPQKHFHCAIDHLARFLAQFFGGPPIYSEVRGHPRLRQRHLPFAIGPKERDAWVVAMLGAMDACGIEEPARTPMRRYFEEAAAFLVNKPAEPAG